MRLEVRELLKIAFGVYILVALACSKNDPLKVYRYYAVEAGSSREPITDTLVLHVQGDSVWFEETLLHGRVTGAREIGLPEQVQTGALGGRYPVEGQITFNDRDWQSGLLLLRLLKNQNSKEQHPIKFLLQGVD
jgi:hypothetical protein